MILYIQDIDTQVQNKVYYTGSVLFMSILSFIAIFVYKVDKNVVERLKNKNTEFMNGKWDEFFAHLDRVNFNFDIKCVLLLVIILLIIVMWMDLIDLNLCLHIEFILVLSIALLTYLDIKNFVDYIKNSSIDRLKFIETFYNFEYNYQERGFRDGQNVYIVNGDEKKHENKFLCYIMFGLNRICYSGACDVTIYYHIITLIVLFILLVINDILGMIDIEFDVCAFMFLMYMMFIQYIFLKIQLVFVMIFIFILYNFSITEEYMSLFKLILFSSFFLLNLFLIRLMNQTAIVEELVDHGATTLNVSNDYYVCKILSCVMFLIILICFYNMSDYEIEVKVKDNFSYLFGVLEYILFFIIVLMLSMGESYADHDNEAANHDNKRSISNDDGLFVFMFALFPMCIFLSFFGTFMDNICNVIFYFIPVICLPYLLGEFSCIFSIILIFALFAEMNLLLNIMCIIPSLIPFVVFL